MPRGRLAAVVLLASLLWPVAARAQNSCKAYPTVLCCQAAGGAAAWGDITGTLSAQTDLQTALDGKEASGAFSGIGACAANQWASTLNDTAAPTCTQPAFSNLSGAATDSQVPAGISRDTESPAAGDITGSLSAGYQIGPGAVGTAEVATPLKTQQWGYTLFDPSTDLPNTLDITSIIANRARAVTLTEVYCEIDAGSATINLQRDDGTPANILAADLVCSTSGATAIPAAAEDNVAVGEEIDHVTVSVGAGLRRLTVAITYTVD